jgi:hypothetical protein
MTGPRHESFAAHTALRERNSVKLRLRELTHEGASSWRDREVRDLRLYLREVEGMIAHHREARPLQPPIPEG